ncbi:MAG: isochorismate synthase [Lentisphaerae bacterium]|nr:isochorismate synthase [Lentisphaerota bacterium]
MASIQMQPPPQAFRRVVLPLAGGDPLVWLAGQPDIYPRVYWTSRDRGLEMAGVGAAALVSGPFADGMGPILQRVADVLAQSDPDVRFVGGTRFDAPRPGDEAWAGFEGHWFVLPEVEMIRDRRGTRLVANVDASADVAAVQARLEHLARPVPEPVDLWAELDAPRERRDVPDRAGWDRTMQAALLAMESCEIEKIVLARRTTLAFAHPLDPLLMLRRLRDVTRDCFHFCFQPAADTTFIGASPERFYKRDGRAIETEAVAGTRPRGAPPDADRRLGEALLASDKDRREHLFVRDMIRAVLAPLCDDVRVDPQPSLLKLARGQHLFSGIDATLRVASRDADLFAGLHPTPAVGGCATPSALARIRAWEAFDRGWYAAPVGWIGRDAAEFAVAIRSALCRGTELALFSGAGVVAGSRPEDEWDEIESKIQDFTRILSEQPLA